MMQWSRHSPLSIVQACQNLPSESVQYPLSRMQRNNCMFVNQLMAEAMMEMVDVSEVQSRATQQLINVFRDCSKAARTCPHAYGRHSC